MADRVFPAGKPQPLNGANPPTFPANKGQLYKAAHPAYRPTPKPPRHRRRGCCRCCCWLTLAVLALVLLVAVAAAVVYLLYRPQRPSFSVSALKLSTFNLTGAGKVTASVDLAVVARNPNKKIEFLYDPTTVAVSSDGADVADGSFPAFAQGAKNTTSLRAAIGSGGARAVDAGAATALRSDLRKGEVPLTVRLETKVRVKMGGVKTEKVGIKVTCDGISAPVPAGKAKAKAAAVAGDGAKCKVKLRIKLWKWQL